MPVAKAPTKSEIKDNLWSKVGGKEGGTISALAHAGSGKDRIIWAGTMAGVFLSHDNGHTWRISNAGLTSPYIQALAVSPNFTKDNQLFAGAVSKGGFRSFSAAKVWEKMEFWGAVPQIACIAYSPTYSTDGIAFLGTDGDGIFRTVNRSKTWNASSVGLPGTSIQALLASPEFGRDNRVYCAVAEHGLFRSDDGGRTWSPAGAKQLGKLTVQSITSSPALADGGRLFAGTETEGLWFSDDGGESWAQGDGLEGMSVNAIAVSPRYRDDSVVFAGVGEGGVYRSIDNGKSWRRVTPPDASDSVLSLIALAEPASKTLVLAGTYERGILRSDDGGHHWTASSTSLTSQNWVCFAMSPNMAADGIMLAGGTNSGIFRSTDRGAAWSDAAPELAGLTVNRIATSSRFAEDGIAFAASSEGLFVTRDEAKTWKRVTKVIGKTELRGVGLAPAFGPDGTALCGGPLGRAFMSTDGGNSFVELDYAFGGEAISDVAFSPRFAEDRVVFVGSIGDGLVTVHKSADAGKTWRKWVQHPCETQWISVAVPSHYNIDADLWFFAAENQVFKPARRLRQVWSGTHPSSRDTAVLNLALSPDYAAEPAIFAATSNGVWRSADGGMDWQEINHGLGNRAVLQVAASPNYHEDRLVYLLGLGGEIWRYRDVPETRTLKQTKATDYI